MKPDLAVRPDAGKWVVDAGRPAVFLESGENRLLISRRLAKLFRDDCANPEFFPSRIPVRVRVRMRFGNFIKQIKTAFGEDEATRILNLKAWIHLNFA